MASSPTSPVEALLRERLSRVGRISLAEFMELVLYEPEVGYYATQTVLGAAGDYVTSPELHPAFGALLGRQLEDTWRGLGCPSEFRVREVGAGSGVMCRDILRWAEASAPDFLAALTYEIFERNVALRRRQQATLERAGLATAKVVCPGEEQSAGAEHHAVGVPFAGCVVSNELLDSFPVHLVAVSNGRLLERYVVLDGERFTYADDDPSTPELARYFATLGFRPGEGCVAEVNLAALRWMGEAAAWLERGLLLTIDYGYPASVLYAPSRRHGSLLCYYRHTLNSDPLARLGRQDITSHVDFTSLARAGEQHGLATVALVSQARALSNLGLRDYISRLPDLPPAEREANRRALHALVDPGGLGRVGFLFQQRGMDAFVPRAVREDVAGLSDAFLPRLGPDALRLPGPEDLEASDDFLDMWNALVSGDESRLDA